LSYKALPDALRIGDSQVAGQGIFATEDIPIDTNLGLSHIILEGINDPIYATMASYSLAAKAVVPDLASYVEPEIIRTPLGGFINHSDDPNCVKFQNNNRFYIKTIRPIKAGDELFLKYTFYSVHK
tara:strand:+ start:212 stop:589 length:378 start_codon:yes stop_codon:yes gene_type:complete